MTQSKVKVKVTDNVTWPWKVKVVHTYLLSIRGISGYKSHVN